MRVLTSSTILSGIFCALVGAAGASEVPKAFEGVDLSDVQRVNDTEADQIRGSAWSPNGFPKGQCTWYVDGRTKEYSGWILKFSQNYGRDAYKWWDMVTNAKKGQLGYRGDVMVFNKWTGNPYGHVAFVESSTPGSTWNVSHANWTTGSPVRYIEGYPIYNATFAKSSTGYVKRSGSSSVYPVRGFLYK
jgi:surface antigen